MLSVEDGQVLISNGFDLQTADPAGKVGHLSGIKIVGRRDLRRPQLLVLGEPTAALDAKSEHEVFQRFADLTEGKLALFISHRFSTVRMADRILVLEEGRIA